MAELPSDFWAGWIAVLTFVSFAGLTWVVFSIYFAGSAGEDGEGPVWDENLREGENPPPLWWFWFIFALMILSVVYLMLYPGIGRFTGALAWTQAGQLDERHEVYERRFADIRAEIEAKPLTDIRADANLMASAQGIYDRHCLVCHGADASGQADAFPSLRDDVWQWGQEPAQIEHSIRYGRMAVMVGWQQMAGDEGVEQLTDYVIALRGGNAEGHPGTQLYTQFCVACHGVDGGGNPLLGAPDLKAPLLLYGDSRDAIRHSIAEGRRGEMPAFDGRLDGTQIRLLVALLTTGVDSE